MNLTLRRQGINNILCVIDFSEGSRQALHWAASLASEYGAKLTILYSYRLNRQLGDNVFEWKKKREADIVSKFQVYESDILKDTAVNYEFKMEVGFVTDRVEEFTRKNQVSLLVIDKSVCVLNRDALDELLEQMTIPVMITP